MAFVFRSDKPQQVSKPNAAVGPGILISIQLLITFKCIIRIKYLRLMYLLAAWNLNLDKLIIMFNLQLDPDHIISMFSIVDRKLLSPVKLKISKFFKYPDLTRYSSQELQDLVKLSKNQLLLVLENSKNHFMQ